MKKPYKHSPDYPFDWLPTLSPQEADEKLLAKAKDGDKYAERMARKIAKYGVTKTLVQSIRSKLNDLELSIKPQIAPGTLDLVWQVVPPKGDQLSDEVYANLLGMLAIQNGIADRLKLCAFDECGKMFVGNAKAKYCSDKCGSNVRIRAKRARDKERQML